MVEWRRSWVVPTVVGAVLIALTVVALTRQPVELDPSTPEGTVQTFLQAVASQEWENAVALISEDAPESCTATDLARATDRQAFSASLRDANVFGDSAVVEVTISFAADPEPLGAGAYETRTSYSLQRENDHWLLTGVGWPYLWACPREP